MQGWNAGDLGCGDRKADLQKRETKRWVGGVTSMAIDREGKLAVTSYANEHFEFWEAEKKGESVASRGIKDVSRALR